MKHFIFIAMLLTITSFITFDANAAKESFDRSKPHMAELAKIEKACQTNKKQCDALKKAYKKKYNKEPDLKDYNSSRSNNSSSRAQDYNSSRSNTTSAAKPRDAATGLATGKRQHKAITIAKEACVNGKVVKGKYKDRKCEHRGHVTVLK
jgi:hypothetical protein